MLLASSPLRAGIFSYASLSDGGKGIQHMWAIGNALRLQGITTYCGLVSAP
jgi:hypothetical protein